MKLKYAFLFFLSTIGLWAQVTVSPAVFNVTDQITITASFASANCNTMGANPAKVYMHAGIGDDANFFAFSVVGNWGQDDGVGQMTNNGNGTWSITIVPSVYFNLNATQQANATKLGLVIRNANGSQSLRRTPACDDFRFNVGSFQMTLNSPVANSTTILASGGSMTIAATNTNGPANYTLRANGVAINSGTGTSYSFNHTNISVNQIYELEAVQGTSTIVKRFAALVNPGTISEALPSGAEDGITYSDVNNTLATLVLDAPGKEFVYVAGSFNNYQPGPEYAMKKDPATGKFWLTVGGLAPGVDYTYQYWVGDMTPAANSPVLVKTADPYSTLVLSPFDDSGISPEKYPNMPAYPSGQEREVTVLTTGQAAYDWQVTNFVKPLKEDLVIYEVLVRDFDSDRSYQDLIDKIGYFRDLKINAIQLMPVMEFEGNESWGYNTAFHLANDKFYGPADKLRELVDVCHQNGIAVILDLALNHAFGRNPMVRMWMTDPDGDGWGGPSADNPYFNVSAMHSYSVGNDFNHTLPRTEYYTKRVIDHWINEYKIDGFRWDLTKGFTQQCPSNVPGGQEACTNGFRSDRVAILTEYARYSWETDPTHYVIFEHLGTDGEESIWANYKIDETPSKGVMMWGKMTDPYSQLSMGFNSNNDIRRIGHQQHTGFIGKRVIGYAESHDEERLMYRNLQFGNSSQAAHNVKNLDVALSRMPAIGAMSLLVPGPKMIWHFGELGWDLSIFTCNNGTVNLPNVDPPGDCKLDTKPQPQWANNWLGNAGRSQIFSDWSKMIELKRANQVFRGNYELNSGTTLQPRLHVFDAAIPEGQLRNVVVLSNFDVVQQNVVASFPYAGTWYNLMDNSTLEVANPGMAVTIPAGQFRAYGNAMPQLGSDPFEMRGNLTLSPNPSSQHFSLNTAVKKVEIFSLTGQLVKSFAGAEENRLYDVGGLAKGMYLVKATDEHNRSATLKLIKE